MGLLDNRAKLKEASRIVVKVGTSTLTYSSGRLNLKQMEKLVRQLADLYNAGKEVILVTSGAVGAGVGSSSTRPAGRARSRGAAGLTPVFGKGGR